MSFILDALQKAERERDLARGPGLRTVHVWSSPGARRLGLWAVPLAFLVGAGVAAWVLIPSPRVPPPGGGEPPARPPARAPEGGGELHRAPARLQAALPPPASPEAPAPARPGSDPRRQAPSRPARKEPAEAPPLVAAPPAAADLRPAQGERGREGSPEERSGAGQPRPAAGRTARPGGHRQRRRRARPRPRLRRAWRPPPSTEARALPPPPPADPTPALLEAIARMKLNVFVYADARDKRMVVIDGRRYTEGDQVDGRYLLEAITSEGAVLSHGGARAILRP